MSKLDEFFNRKEVQTGISICRVLLVIFMALILYVLIREIEAVKILAYDVCELCMNKTGCSCTCVSNNLFGPIS